MLETRKIQVLNLVQSMQKAEMGARFDKPIGHTEKVYLLSNGLSDAAHWASSCMGWIWRQWLLGESPRNINSKIKQFVERGLEMRSLSKSYHKLPLHDLYLMQCAIFASDDLQMRRVAELVGDSSGDKYCTPKDLGSGELYAAAWSGMLKYWILGDVEKSVEESQVIWGAHRENGVMAATKSLVMPWLKKDWEGFKSAQEKDFDKLWKRARKDLWTVREETQTEIVVTTERYQVEHQWCWAHCGLALLAYRNGIGVLTDPFWFPAHSLKVVDLARSSI